MRPSSLDLTRSGSKTQHDFLYDRNDHPFGNSWEKWAATWCNWLLSIPKRINPATDETGKFCSINQNDENVWFLTGTFGNIIPIKRKCVIPAGKAILFPILEKEDSFTEDRDLKTESELIKRSKDATDKVAYVEAAIDGEQLDNLSYYRVQSELFDLRFPKGNVYDVTPGLTRSVCDGYWIFIKPLDIGKHSVYFKGENLLADPYTTTQMKKTKVYDKISKLINEESRFKIEVLYELTITNQSEKHI